MLWLAPPIVIAVLPLIGTSLPLHPYPTPCSLNSQSSSSLPLVRRTFLEPQLSVCTLRFLLQAIHSHLHHPSVSRRDLADVAKRDVPSVVFARDTPLANVVQRDAPPAVDVVQRDAPPAADVVQRDAPPAPEVVQRDAPVVDDRKFQE